MRRSGAIRLAAISVAAAIVSGCAAERRAPPSPPPAAAAGTPGMDGLRVVLLWGDPVDLDLYVTDPVLETVYFANNSSTSGGKLDRDASCRDAKEERLEATRWREPPRGHYRVGIDFSDRCGQDTREVRYRLVVDVRGKRLEKEGTVRLARFIYEAIEFDVREDTRAR